MAHSYIPNWKTSFYLLGGARGFDLSDPKDIKVNVSKAFEEFKIAIPRVRNDIAQPLAVHTITQNLMTYPHLKNARSFQAGFNSTSGSTYTNKTPTN